ncbi:MAG: ribosome-binding factor A [bacterium]
MQGRRNEKISSLLMKMAADFTQRVSNGNSIITITGVDISDDKERTTILFTTLPDSEELRALEFLKRQRSDFREYVKKFWKMRVLPFFDFEIDKGEKNRQRIDELLNQTKV